MLCRFLYSLLVIYMQALVNQLPRLGKRELTYLLFFTCNVVSVGGVSSSSGRLGWTTLLYYGTP